MYSRIDRVVMRGPSEFGPILRMPDIKVLLWTLHRETICHTSITPPPLSPPAVVPRRFPPLPCLPRLHQAISSSPALISPPCAGPAYAPTSLSASSPCPLLHYVSPFYPLSPSSPKYHQHLTQSTKPIHDERPTEHTAASLLLASSPFQCPFPSFCLFN